MPVAAPPAAPAPSAGIAHAQPRWRRRHDAILDLFTVLAAILAVRLALFLTLGGAFALAVMAMRNQSIIGIGVLVSYASLTIAPLCWLELRGKPNLRG